MSEPTTAARPDIRPVKMHRSMWEGDGIHIRADNGQAIIIDWGEPDAEGWWEPTFRVSGTTEADRIAEARAAARLETVALEEAARNIVVAHDAVPFDQAESYIERLCVNLAAIDALRRDEG